jgi:hypothetical protein
LYPKPIHSARCSFPPKSGKTFRVALLILACGSIPASWAQSAQDLINQAHSQRDRYSGYRPPSYERPQKSAADREAEAWAKKMEKQDQANAERARQQKAFFDKLDAQAGEAFMRGDKREGLRFLHELRIAYRNAGIYSPQLEESIGRTEALLAWNAAKTSAEFSAAMKIQPHFFSSENLAYVEKLEAIEEYARRRPARAAEEQAAMGKMHTMIDQLASTLDDPRQVKMLVLDHGSAEGAPDAFLTRKSNPRPRADTGDSDEHESMRSSIGFDTPGQLYIKERSGPPPIPIGRVIIPDRYLKDSAFVKHPAVIQLRTFEAQADEANRAAAAKVARYEEEATKNPNSNALLVLLAGAKDAQSRADSAENAVAFQINEIERTVTFKPFATGDSSHPDATLSPNATTKESP